MSTIRTWEFHDRSDWADGPWMSEADKYQWTDEATGLTCLIVRSHMGFLCGYVGVAEGHPLYGQHYDAVPDVVVHGGLTYAAPCQEENKEKGICHVSEPGEPDNMWWFGFDCAHLGDEYRVDGQQRTEGNYRDVAYVRSECTRLAEQLAAVPVPM